MAKGDAASWASSWAAITKCTIPFAKTFLHLSSCCLGCTEGSLSLLAATFPPNLCRPRLLRIFWACKTGTEELGLVGLAPTHGRELGDFYDPFQPKPFSESGIWNIPPREQGTVDHSKIFWHQPLHHLFPGCISSTRMVFCLRSWKATFSAVFIW